MNGIFPCVILLGLVENLQLKASLLFYLESLSLFILPAILFIVKHLQKLKSAPIGRCRDLGSRYRRAIFSVSIMFIGFSICFLPYLFVTFSGFTWFSMNSLYENYQHTSDAADLKNTARFSIHKAFMSVQHFAIIIFCCSTFLNNSLYVSRIPEIRNNWRVIHSFCFSHRSNTSWLVHSISCNFLSIFMFHKL